MNALRLRTVLGTVAALGLLGTLLLKQRLELRGLQRSQRALAEQCRQLSTTNAQLLSTDAARDGELARLRQQTAEILSLRNQVAQMRRQQAAGSNGNQSSQPEKQDAFAGYVTRDQLSYAGLDSPENAFRSLEWAATHDEYTNWLAALAPRVQEEERAKPTSLEEFRREAASGTKGMQVLATKPVGDDRVELKVRVDTENSVAILIFPMVAVGNEWRLGDDIQPYTQRWDSPVSAP